MLWKINITPRNYLGTFAQLGCKRYLTLVILVLLHIRSTESTNLGRKKNYALNFSGGWGNIWNYFNIDKRDFLNFLFLSRKWFRENLYFVLWQFQYFMSICVLVGMGCSSKLFIISKLFLIDSDYIDLMVARHFSNRRNVGWKPPRRSIFSDLPQWQQPGSAPRHTDLSLTTSLADLQTNLREDWSFTIMEKAPTKVDKRPYNIVS